MYQIGVIEDDRFSMHRRLRRLFAIAAALSVTAFLTGSLLADTTTSKKTASKRHSTSTKSSSSKSHTTRTTHSTASHTAVPVAKAKSSSRSRSRSGSTHHVAKTAPPQRQTHPTSARYAEIQTALAKAGYFQGTPNEIG